MPQPHLRTRRKKRFKVPLPGGRSRIHYKRKKASAPLCFKCGRSIAGLSNLKTAEITKLSRSKRRIKRIYAGDLCHICLKEALKKAVRTL